ncbi:MAG: AAA family ATPase [Caldilineaceae bacterium]
MLKFPYGNSNFYQVSTEGFFYVDRTQCLPWLEEFGQQLLFLRPRRFGKSLWLSVLENYYDVAKADEFAHIFGRFAIGQKPTPLHNRYLIMVWDFSTVQTYDDSALLLRSLYNHVNNAITLFAQRYAALLPVAIEIFPEDALASFGSLLNAVQQSPYRLYLLIDEYDNFANEVLMSGDGDGQQRYEELVKGEGVFKTLFKNIKAGARGGGVERVFITGVSPVVMADMSSGYNVAENIYLLPELNELCGFTEAETLGALQQVAQQCGFSAEKTAEAMTMMRLFYNGYQFSTKAGALVYNPTLVVYFLKILQRTCEYPEEILDDNLAMDGNRIAYIAQIKGAESLITGALNEENPLTISTLAHRFGVAEMLASEKSLELLTALMYYLGVLTLAGRNELGKLMLRIPNLVIRRLYADRLRQLFLPNSQSRDLGKVAAEQLYQFGQIEPLCAFVQEKILAVLDNRDYRQANELTIKMAFLALLFEDHFFIVDSEPALARGYGDLLLLIRPDMRQYKLLDILLEFKFVKLSETGLDGQAVRQQSAAEVAALDAVKVKFAEAKTQLQSYRATLTQKYGAALRLRTYAVVAIGFDRLLWQEV